MKSPNGIIRRSRFGRAGNKAGQALGKTWPYVLAGLLVGGGLLTLHEYLPPSVPELVRKLVEHLGVGFLVSAIAVFFYEWGSHAKEMRETNIRLLEWEQSLPEENLGKSIRKLFGEEAESPLSGQASELSVQCSNLILHFAYLLAHRETWANSEYLGFLSNFLGKFLVSNSEAFRSLPAKGECRVVMPSSAIRSASDLLERYVSTMGNGDSYRVVANMAAWSGDELGHFHVLSSTAITKGATVKRVFNFTQDYGVKLQLRDVIKVLKQHVEEIEKSGEGYQAKVLGQAELTMSNSVVLRQKIRQAHFAIIQHADRSIRLRFEGYDLGNLLLTQNELTVATDENLFVEAWGAATDLNLKNLNAIIARLAQELDQPIPDGSLLSEPPVAENSEVNDD